MRYFLAILLPPLAVLLCGKPIQFFFNILLTLFFWVPGSVHAILVVHEYHESKRHAKLMRAVARGA